MLRIISNSCEQTEKIGKNFAHKLFGTEIIALFGDLGVGKTTFTKGICLGLDIKTNVCSPTFSIINEYDGRHKVYHFDMYRVKNMDDLYSTGFFDYIGNGIIIIEWSENIEKILPQNSIKIFIEYGDCENQRIFNFEGVNMNENFSD